MSNDPIYMNKEDEIAEIVLNRPDKLNALNAEVWQGIIELFGQAGDDPDIKVVILRSGAPRAFAAGADISEFPDLRSNSAQAQDYGVIVAAALDALTNCRHPTTRFKFYAR